MAMSKWINDPVVAGPIQGMLDAIGLVMDLMIIRRVIDDTMLATLLQDAMKRRLATDESQETLDAAGVLSALAGLILDPERVEARLRAMAAPSGRGTA